MNRDKEKEFLSAYLDGEIENADAVRRQLQQDEALAHHYVQYQKISAHLKAMPEPETDPAFTQRVMTQVKEASQKRPLFWTRQARPMAVAAGLLLIVGLAVPLFWQSPAPRSDHSARVPVDEARITAEIVRLLEAGADDSILVEDQVLGEEGEIEVGVLVDWLAGEVELAQQEDMWQTSDDVWMAMEQLEQAELEEFKILLEAYLHEETVL